jgi:effector-binding domain-containing protein
MKIEIIEKPFALDIFGFSGAAWNKDYARTAFELSGKMWEVVKGKGIRNKGQNVWVYDANDGVFAGVELEDPRTGEGLLERKTILIAKYAYFKHVGPYKLIKQVGQGMAEEISRQGFKTSLPYVEIYGHWNKDESKLETELLMRLE